MSACGCEISGCKMSAHEIPDVKCRRTEFLPEWTELCRKGDRLRVQGVGTSLPDDTECARLSGSTPSRFPQVEAHSAREISHPNDGISYPDMLSGSCSAAILSGHLCSLHSGFAHGKGLQSFGSSCFWAFHCFAMDSKELSSISDCFGDKKAIKTPKLNTIWLELIVRVFNMLIGLKGDNYYSKVFKMVNYKLWNNTFWVVINNSSHSILFPITLLFL